MKKAIALQTFQMGSRELESCQKFADAQLHRHNHGVQAQHVILCLQGNAIGSVLQSRTHISPETGLIVLLSCLLCATSSASRRPAKGTCQGLQKFQRRRSLGLTAQHSTA